MVRYSQVFLKDENIIGKILNSVDKIKEDEVLIEIGPGAGALSRSLIKNFNNFYAVEIDNVLAEKLKKEIGQINVINQDFLEMDLAPFESKYKGIYFVGNLPYKISTAIVEKILGIKNFKGAVFMFQKEVAHKLIATKDNGDYGYLSCLVKIQMEIEHLFDVSRYSFEPVPKVDSSIVKLKARENNLTEEEILNYRKTISYSFMYKRKTILNSLFLSFKNKYGKEQIESMLKSVGISPNLRAEALEYTDFLKLSHILFDR